MPDLTGAYDPADDPEVDPRLTGIFDPHAGVPYHYHPQSDLPLPSRVSTTERRYTLDEARAIIAREQCDAEGHDLDQTLLRVPSGRVVRRIITCSRCTAAFQETTS